MIGLFFFILVPMVGAEKVTPETNATAINTVWTLIAAFLVFFMQAGFAIMFGVDSLGLFGAGGFFLSGGGPSTDEVFGLPYIQFLYLCGDLSARGPLDMG